LNNRADFFSYQVPAGECTPDQLKYKAELNATGGCSFPVTAAARQNLRGQLTRV
jgi:hypothetical protein